jgi:hypothetical protein
VRGAIVAALLVSAGLSGCVGAGTDPAGGRVPGLTAFPDEGALLVPAQEPNGNGVQLVAVRGPWS